MKSQGERAGDCFERAAAAIRREHRRKMFDSIAALWRVGDTVCLLRSITCQGAWRRTLDDLAERVGVAAARLDDAARASAAFPIAEREALLQTFDEADADLTLSQVVELGRTVPRTRALGIGALLSTRMSTRELRAFLKNRQPALCDSRIIVDHAEVVPRHEKGSS
jgi:hypothetical protein